MREQCHKSSHRNAKLCTSKKKKNTNQQMHKLISILINAIQWQHKLSGEQVEPMLITHVTTFLFFFSIKHSWHKFRILREKLWHRLCSINSKEIAILATITQLLSWNLCTGFQSGSELILNPLLTYTVQSTADIFNQYINTLFANMCGFNKSTNRVLL